MGRLLRLMRERELYRSLGFVRLGDYVVERIGVSYRTAQELMRADEALERLPLATAAYDAGEVTSEQVRLLTRVASPESEAFWIGLARNSSVRTLARAVAGKVKVGSAVSQEEAELERVQIAAPAWVAALWRDTVALVRRIAGGALPPGACLEMVLAESADIIPPSEEETGTTECASAPASEGTWSEKHGRPQAGQGVPSVRTDSEVPTESACERIDATAGPSTHIDARAVDRELRRLTNECQRRDAALAEHLRLVALDRGYRHLGYASLEEYAIERLGLHARTLYNLLALGRVLERLPELHRAFVAGRLTHRQGILVGGVASRVTVASWVRRAESVTLRRLEDEVIAWQHLKEARPSVWELLEGGPFPEGLILAPGQAPRLQASAPPTLGLSFSETPPFALADGSLSPSERISAARFLEALAVDEEATQLPERLVVIRLLVEPGVRRMWGATLAHLRSTERPDLCEWAALAIVLQRFWSVWDNVETRRQRRENPTVERDGWRCTAPACRSEGTGRLHEHHIVFRTAGGSINDPSNVTTLCSAHHLGLLHEGKMRCSGHAPGGLVWELGVEPRKQPFLVYAGDKRIGGAAG